MIFLCPGIARQNFIILPTFLDSNKCCRNDVEAGTKWQNFPKLSSMSKIGAVEKISSHL